MSYNKNLLNTMHSATKKLLLVILLSFGVLNHEVRAVEPCFPQCAEVQGAVTIVSGTLALCSWFYFECREQMKDNDPKKGVEESTRGCFQRFLSHSKTRLAIIGVGVISIIEGIATLLIGERSCLPLEVLYCALIPDIFPILAGFIQSIYDCAGWSSLDFSDRDLRDSCIQVLRDTNREREPLYADLIKKQLDDDLDLLASAAADSNQETFISLLDSAKGHQSIKIFQAPQDLFNRLKLEQITNDCSNFTDIMRMLRSNTWEDAQKVVDALSQYDNDLAELQTKMREFEENKTEENFDKLEKCSSEFETQYNNSMWQVRNEQLSAFNIQNTQSSEFDALLNILDLLQK